VGAAATTATAVSRRSSLLVLVICILSKGSVSS
jgi:hypothetical protein